MPPPSPPLWLAKFVPPPPVALLLTAQPVNVRTPSLRMPPPFAVGVTAAGGLDVKLKLTVQPDIDNVPEFRTPPPPEPVPVAAGATPSVMVRSLMPPVTPAPTLKMRYSPPVSRRTVNWLAPG